MYHRRGIKYMGCLLVKRCCLRRKPNPASDLCKLGRVRFRGAVVAPQQNRLPKCPSGVNQRSYHISRMSGFHKNFPLGMNPQRCR